MTTTQSLFRFFLLAGAALFLLCPEQARAALAVADQSSGYSGLVLEKISRHWRPPTDPSPRTSHIRLTIDSQGRVTSCKPTAPSGNPDLDASLCAAAKAAGDFAVPPYSMPIDIFLHFWTGRPGQSAPPEQTQQQDAMQTMPSQPPIQTRQTDSPSVTLDAAPPAESAAAARDSIYTTSVMEKIRPNIVLPKGVKGERSSTVHILIDPKGRIVRSLPQHGTKADAFDRAMIKAINKTGKVAPPPDGQIRELVLTFVLETQ